MIVSIQELILCYFYEALGLLLAEAFVENQETNNEIMAAAVPCCFVDYSDIEKL